MAGPGASLAVFFGVPVTKIITEATLALRYAAPLLAPNEGRIEILLNGTSVGAVALAPGTAVRAEIPLPTDLLTTDNTLVLRLAGACRACPARAPWIMVDPASTLGTSGTRLPLANDLALLPVPFFDPTSQRSWQLPVVFSDPPGSDEVKAAAVVASWFGVASDVRGARFPVTIGALPDGHALVFARRGSAIEAELALPPQPDALIAIRESPRDPYGKLLVVAGRSSADLLAAALSLVTSNGWPHADAANVRRADVEARPQYGAPRWLTTEEPAPIGLYTSADRLRVTGSGSVNIYLRLPPDLFLAARQSVPLRLRFDYAGVTDGSGAALHVRVNDQDVDGFALAPSAAPVRREEVVWLPTGALRPYANTLTVVVDFGQGGRSAEGRQHLAVHRESTVDLRALPHSVVLPRLELVADAGYPFTAWPDLSRTAFVLPDTPGPVELEALFNLAGFFGAQTGAPATAVSVVDAARIEEVRDRDLVVLGTLASQPLLSAWSARMPLGPVAGDRWQVSAPAPYGWLRPYWPFREADHERLATITTTLASFDLILEHFVSPLHPDRSAVAIVPGGAQGADVVATMFTPARQGPVYGGVAVSRGGRFESFLVGSVAYHAGRAGPSDRALVTLLEHYWLIPPVVALLALGFGRALNGRLERVAVRRLMSGGHSSASRGGST
jgi:cellulose synthase (UDP-forming)